MDELKFEKAMAEVVAAMIDAGYDPVAQLTGFLQTSVDSFITRRGDARTIIRTLDKAQIKDYFEKHIKHGKGAQNGYRCCHSANR